MYSENYLKDVKRGNLKKRLLIVTNVDWFLISHRLILAKAAKSAGWDVYVACEDTGRAGEIAVEGVQYVPFSFSRSGTNILEEIKLLAKFKRLYKEIKPDVVHQITIKPVVYGSIAAEMEKIPGVVNAISGLGYMFTQGREGLMQRVIFGLMKFGVRRKGVAFIFQNNEDKHVLEKYRVFDERNSTYLIKGSGVNLEKFSFQPLPDSEVIKILLPCRMLWDKGVKELRETSDILKSKYQHRIQFVLVGMADNDNRAGVPESYMTDWEDGDYVVWKGHQIDMAPFYKDCHIVVLPSYREGLPKTLIEACAIGRPIVTTDAIGCKDCVDEGVNGFKVPVKNSAALANAIEKLINDKDLMERMGVAGRRKAEREFDEKDVIKTHLEIYDAALH